MQFNNDVNRGYKVQGENYRKEECTEIFPGEEILKNVSTSESRATH
jgi:hypothetical protein